MEVKVNRKGAVTLEKFHLSRYPQIPLIWEGVCGERNRWRSLSVWSVSTVGINLRTVMGSSVEGLRATCHSRAAPVGKLLFDHACPRGEWNLNKSILGWRAASVCVCVSGLQGCFESGLGVKRPALVLVPVLELPDSALLHLSCWFST